MHILDPRSELFNKVIELVEDVDLECFSLGSFTKENASEILEKLNDSKAPEKDILDMLSYYDDDDFELEEDDSAIQVVDITDARYGLSDIPKNSPNIVKCIAYLNDSIKKFVEGKVVTMTAICLLEDGRSSIWVPDGFDEKTVDKLFDPVILELKSSKTELQPN